MLSIKFVWVFESDWRPVYLTDSGCTDFMILHFKHSCFVHPQSLNICYNDFLKLLAADIIHDKILPGPIFQ